MSAASPPGFGTELCERAEYGRVTAAAAAAEPEPPGDASTSSVAGHGSVCGKAAGLGVPPARSVAWVLAASFCVRSSGRRGLAPPLSA